jgi:hypothetical protein
LLKRRDHDIDYAYTSQITPTATPAFIDVFHPVEPFQVLRARKNLLTNVAAVSSRRMGALGAVRFRAVME